MIKGASVNMPTKKIGWVECLRALLIFYIAFHHFTSRYMDFYPEAEFSITSEIGGIVGNFMFMMISGYFLAKTLLRGYGFKDIFKYCIDRWWRLFPAILICTTITYIIVCLSPLDARSVSFTQFLGNLFIIHPSIPYVDGSHWFAAALLQMQLLLSVLLLIRNERNRVYCIVGLSVFSLCLHLIFDIPDTRLDNILYYLTYSSWLPVLLSGSILYYVRSNVLSTKFVLIPIIMVVLHLIKFNNWILIIPFCFFVLFISGKMKINCPIWLAKWGGVSLYWYLLHQNIGFCIMNELRAFGVSSEALLVSFAMIGTISLAFGVKHILKFIPTKLIK